MLFPLPSNAFNWRFMVHGKGVVHGITVRTRAHGTAVWTPNKTPNQTQTITLHYVIAKYTKYCSTKHDMTLSYDT